MIILGIDTSCDDTCIALLKIENCKLKILSNIVSSQARLHAKYGGVYPFLAKREHQRNLPFVLRRALKEAGFAISNFKFLISKQIPNSKHQIPNIDFIGVTIGPGLEPCLWEGVNFAKELAKKLKVPIVPVNHIEAHILANWLKPVSKNFQFSIFNFQTFLPAVCLVVSGGHTQLILMENFGKYKILGETRDDAAGECFDKAARILDLGYPGGPAIAAEAAKFSIFNSQFSIKLPRPMIYQKNYDFSFSGLKTAVLYLYQKSKISPPPSFDGSQKVSGEIKAFDLDTRTKDGRQENQKFKQAICFEVQQAIIDVLIRKTIKAAKDFRAKSIILGGGVVANEELRKQFKENVKCQIPNVKLFMPEKKFCTDNAAMVALTAFFHHKKIKRDWQEIKAETNLNIGPCLS